VTSTVELEKEVLTSSVPTIVKQLIAERPVPPITANMMFSAY
jgi:hypothetical protein